MPELSKNLLGEMNKQIQEELYSAYLYFAMSAWFETLNLPGSAHWMRVQAMEEVSHAQKFYNHIVERDGVIELREIAKPESSWASPLAAFKAALDHERFITSRIHKLVSIAREEHDYSSEIGTLNWFVEEQIEEETNAETMVQKLTLIGSDSNQLYQLDKENAMRVFTPNPLIPW